MTKSVVFAFEAHGAVLEFRAWQCTSSLASKFEVLASTIVGNIFCNDVTPCRLAAIYRRYVGTYTVHAQKDTDDGGGSFLQNVGIFIQEQKASNLKTQYRSVA